MNILLIEDDLGLVELITAMLEELGFSIMSATSGVEAIAHLKKQTPDLMLLDYSLPDINGKELIETLIKQQTTLPPFIITTGQGDERIAVDMMKLGAMDYLIKDMLFLEKLPDVVKRVIKEIESDDKLKQAEEKIRVAEEENKIKANFYLNIINTMGDAVFVKDDQSRLLLVNDAFCKLFDLSGDEIIGKTLAEDVSQEERERFLMLDKQVITEGKDNITEETLTVRNGKTKTISTRKTRYIDNHGERFLVGVIRDLTERRNLERQFINAFIDAQEVEKQAYGEDLHDGISQILAAEAMYIDILIENNKDRLNGKAKFLTKIKELNICALQDARNIAHGLMAKQLKEGGLLKAIEHICTDYGLSRDINFNLTHKGLVETDFAKEVKINIFRIIQEISTNTLRHSLAKKVTIKMSKVGKDSLKLIVKDNGVGLDLEKMKKDNWGGGLKNIERRVTLLNGVLKLDSEPNKGTCYTITVPLFN